jgi:O-acetylserine/cysteine efflux transporter
MEIDKTNRLSTIFPLSSTLLAIFVVFIWGTNFVVIKKTEAVVPPFTLAALRFIFTLFPGIFFLKKPKVNVLNIAGYGLAIGVVQFGFMYTAINGLITAGLASLVVQTQIIFTIGMSVIISAEIVKPYQWLTLAFAFLGLIIIGINSDEQTTILGITYTLIAALGWSLGNIFSKKAGNVNMLSYVVWSSIFSVPVLLCLAFYFEGGLLLFQNRLKTYDLDIWISIFWQAWGNSLLGYGVWGWLLSRYQTASVSQFALMIPIFGIGSSVLILGEPLPPWKITGATLVIGAMLISFFGEKLFNNKQQNAL